VFPARSCDPSLSCASPCDQIKTDLKLSIVTILSISCRYYCRIGSLLPLHFSKTPAKDSLHPETKMADTIQTAPINAPPNSATSDLHGGESHDAEMPKSADAGIPSDELAATLAAAALPQDKDKSFTHDAPGFLRLFLASASTPDNNAFNMEDAVKTLGLARICTTGESDLEQEEFKAMASGMLKLMEDPNWNIDPTQLICQIRQIQEKAAKIRNPVLADAKYGTGIPLVWKDMDTVHLLNAADIYLRNQSQFHELSASTSATLIFPYLSLNLQLKMIAEEQSQSRRTKRGELTKGTATESVKSGNGKQVAKSGRAALKPSVPLVGKLASSPRGSHPQNVIDSAVDWLRLCRGVDANTQRYYRDLCTMWTSGEFEWSRGQPIPTQTQVYYWLKNSRRERPPVVDHLAVSKKQRMTERNQAMKRLTLALKSRALDYPAGSRGQFGLIKCLDTVLLLYANDGIYKQVLLLAQTSKAINLRIKRSEVFMQAQRIMQGRLVDIDAQLVLAQMNSSPSKPGHDSLPAISRPEKQSSSIQIFVDFSNLAVSLQANALKGFKGDFKDTVINLGDVLKTERLVYIGEGGFGSVFALKDMQMAIKIFKRPGRLEQAVQDVANEASCFHLASTLNRMGARGITSSRAKFLPFAPLPITGVAGSTSGAIALPSWGLGENIYYPALLMELALGSINVETRELSKSFFSDSMGRVSDEGFSRLASLMRFIAEPLAAMHSLNLAHRDVKEDNILALRVAPGIHGYIYYNTGGKKWTGRMGDCGKALSFGVEFDTEAEASGTSKLQVSKRARQAVAAVGNPARDFKQDKLAFPRGEFKASAEMASELGTVPLVIPMSIIHMINPVAPSTQKQKTSDGIRRKAPQYSGTMTYTPPEPMPPRPDGEQFLTSRDYQPGDMWSLGVVLANVLGGSGLRLSLMSSHDKQIFAEAEDRVVWSRLNKLPAALTQGRVPEQWADVMDLLRSLTRLRPHERLTAVEVLEHPFLKKADLLARMYS
jgi:serine/threonine protein kinase